MAPRNILGFFLQVGVNFFKDAPGWSEDGQGWPQGTSRKGIKRTADNFYPRASSVILPHSSNILGKR